MRFRSFATALLAASAAGHPSPVAAQAAPERSIRRDIPLTNMIRRGFAAGTRDSSGRPGRSYWQLRTDYSIDARLDPATAAITGRETVVIRNTSDSPMRTIVLRLDQNIYAPNVPRAEQVPEITEGMKVTRLTVNGAAVDLTTPREARRPEGGAEAPRKPQARGLDQTIAWISLPTAVAAGASVTLEADWHFQVPHADGQRGLRMGAWGDSLFQVAQWYPRVAVFDDLRAGGWDTDPYLGPSEFYNNFGSFDVRLDVPAGWVVGASGVLQNPDQVLTPAVRERLSHVLESDSTRIIVGPGEFGPGQATAAGDRLVWRFAGDSIADFAWATSNQFIWDATRATIPGKGPIPVYDMYLPGHAAPYAKGGAVNRHALEFYSKLWMPYAFPVFTMVDGPDGGMEYPMFTMSGLGAADHEAGHQWWPMMVGNNETWYGFMDEGFNVYMNTLSGADAQGKPPQLDKIGQSYGRISGDEREAPLMWDANYGGPMYGFQAYSKAPMMLSMLGGIVGDTAVWRAMSGFAHAWRFKHPSPWDYAFFMSHALANHEADLGWFWYSWLFTTDAVDGSIQQATTKGRKITVTVRQDGEMPSPVVLEVRFAAAGKPIKPMANSRMVDSVTALVTWPVNVWFGGRRSFEAVLDFGGRAIEKISLDPAARFPDRDPSDNVWPRSGGTPQPR
jgi:hypothetical protein